MLVAKQMYLFINHLTVEYLNSEFSMDRYLNIRNIIQMCEKM